tara:strand:+ start:37100 stop:38470 length:1371 start_codon:yes stop_codon:yes gene_type:complete
MYSSDDTIVAIATGLGRGGIGVVRISGVNALGIVDSIIDSENDLQPRYATFVKVVNKLDKTQFLDQSLATYFPGPSSYTGEDVVELSCHGNPVMLQEIVQITISAGARLAEPGEFTLRAFLNGRLDLIQAEAVSDLVNAVTPLQARIAFDQLEGTTTSAIKEIDENLFDLIARLEASIDFPEEDYHFVGSNTVASQVRNLLVQTGRLLDNSTRGRLIREGCQVVILGKPNVGKSTLFNRFVGVSRAIVTDIPGTTRDLLTEKIEVDGIPITLVDTAGIRETSNAIELEGVNRARGALSVAGAVILVLDASRRLEEQDLVLLEETPEKNRIVVINKNDLQRKWQAKDLGDVSNVINISLHEETDFSILRSALTAMLVGGSEEILRDTPMLSNLRHIGLVERAETALRRAEKAAEDARPEELVLADLQEALETMEEVTGKRTADDLLNKIFTEFCIGK